MIKLISEKQKNSFNKEAVHPLQSWEWGRFRKLTGNKVIRFGKFKNKKLTDSYQLIIHSIAKIPFKIGSLIKCPTPDQEVINFLKEIAKKEKLIYIKIEPAIPFEIGEIKHKTANREKIISLLKKNGAVAGKTLFTPTTFWIDLTKTDEDLLKSFNSKTRYNVRLSQRRGVKIKEDNSKRAFEKYLDLTGKTIQRQNFYAHTEKYHRLMWKVLHTDLIQLKQKPIARLLTAVYKKEIITTWILFVWHNFLYYPYGASSTKDKNVMANNLIMWNAILYGKKNGLKIFDLWGREPGKGFTKFKEGYNPSVIKFLGTWDLPTNPLYYLYRPAEKLRWIYLKGKGKITSKKRF